VPRSSGVRERKSKIRIIPPDDNLPSNNELTTPKVEQQEDNIETPIEIKNLLRSVSFSKNITESYYVPSVDDYIFADSLMAKKLADSAMDYRANNLAHVITGDPELDKVNVSNNIREVNADTLVIQKVDVDIREVNADTLDIQKVDVDIREVNADTLDIQKVDVDIREVNADTLVIQKVDVDIREVNADTLDIQKVDVDTLDIQKVNGRSERLVRHIRPNGEVVYIPEWRIKNKIVL
jgi:hypothetical protein